MKISWCWILLLGVATGCVPLPSSLPENKKDPLPSEEFVKPASSAAPLTADQVTDSNAREKAKALQEELDREGKEPVKP